MGLAAEWHPAHAECARPGGCTHSALTRPPACRRSHPLLRPQELPADAARELALNCCLNSKAFLIEGGPSLLSFVGNRTECALLVMVRKWGTDYKQVRGQAASKGPGHLDQQDRQLCAHGRRSRARRACMCLTAAPCDQPPDTRRVGGARAGGVWLHLGTQDGQRAGGCRGRLALWLGILQRLKAISAPQRARPCSGGASDSRSPALPLAPRMAPPRCGTARTRCGCTTRARRSGCCGCARPCWTSTATACP
jgi:hypothetical protein